MKEIVYTKKQKLEVRLIKPAEEEQWDQLMDRYHYLGFDRLTGEVLKYAAELEGEWVALIGWGSGVLKCTKRDKWIGWRSDQQWKRLKYVANNQRFLILPGVNIKNLASGILALNTKRISNDWEERYGHPLLLVESFVEKRRFHGACYKAAGWELLGETSGYGRNAKKYYYHGIKKDIYIKELVKGAREMITAELMLPQLIGKRRVIVEVGSVAVTGPGGLLEILEDISDSRGSKGKQHPKKAILAIGILSGLAGMKNYVSMEDFAKGLTQEERKILGCKYDDDKQEYIVPSDSTFYRVYKDTDGEELDGKVGEWISEQVNCKSISLDGKTLRGARLENGKKVHLLAAVAHGSGEVLAQQEVDDKSNEIPAAQPLLDKIDIEGKVITADALHTHEDLANYIKKRQGDYVFIVKDNQANLKKAIEDLEDEDFFPSGENDR